VLRKPALWILVVVALFLVFDILNPLHVPVPHSPTRQGPILISGLGIAGTLLAAGVAVLILAGLALLVLRRLNVVPGPWQNLLEWLVEALGSLMAAVARLRLRRLQSLAKQGSLLRKPVFWFGVIVIASIGFNFIYPYHIAVPHISLAPEEITRIGGLRITNTLLATWLAMLFLVALSFLTTRRLELVPGGLQNLVEWVIESLSNLVEGIAGPRAPLVFPVVMTLFLLIIVCNWMGLLPGFVTIVVIHGEERTPLLRSAATDLNLTLALALFSVVFSQALGIKAAGFSRYLLHFVKIERFVAFGNGLLGRGPRLGVGSILYGLIDLFVGALELLDIFTRVLSFSFRLFGNIFAGEVLLGVVPFLIPLVATLPFLGLEVFVGFVQAFVFAILSTAFVVQATASHGDSAMVHDGSPVSLPEVLSTTS